MSNNNGNKQKEKMESYGLEDVEMVDDDRETTELPSSVAPINSPSTPPKYLERPFE